MDLLGICSSGKKLVAGLLIVSGAASAVLAQDIGFEGPAFTGAGTTPTEAKPESKLWFNDGLWWGSLWSTSGNAFRIHRLSFATHVWTDTGVAIDSRPNSHSDALWDGTKLYIASHQFVANGGASGNPMRVSRYSYDSVNDAYSLDTGFPVTIGDFSTEAMVIAKDSTGVVWAAWTQGQRVRITHTLASDTQWSAPAILPTNTANVNVDDICSIVSYGGNRVGVLWSDQSVNAYRFSFHVDGAADTTWSTVESATTGETDDHLNVKAHSDGRVFVAGKNAANNLLLLVRATSGTWSRFVVTQPSPILTRPIVVLDEPGNLIRVFATGQDTGEVFEKTSPISSISFGTGTGTIRMRDASTVFRISNPTSTKQSVSSATGLVVLAHHDTTGFYWHHDVLPAPPVANFGASPTSGQSPLAVSFTDSSTGSITSRSWNFGDGTTSTATNPSHTYTTVGTFTVSLTATGPGGSDTETKTNLVTVLQAAPVANFSASPTSGAPPLAVSFTDASSGSITSRSWSFGDGGTSTATNPSHTYSSAGSYTVSLTVTGSGGSDTETKTSFIVVSSTQSPPVAAFGAAPTAGPAPLAVAFTDNSTGNISSRSWSFGDGGTSSATSPSHTYTAPGTYTVSLTVTGPNGSDTETKVDLIDVTASGPIQTLLPVADARVNEGSPSSNAGTASELRVRLSTGASYHSYLRFDLSGVVGPVSSARLRLFCTDDSPAGGLVFPTSSSWSETAITWANKPAATGGQIGALGAVALSQWVEVDLTGAVAGGGLVSFLMTSTSSNSALYSSREGANPPQLVIETEEVPVAGFGAAPTSGTAPLLVAFTDASSGNITSRSWSFGDGGTSTATNPSHTYSAAGTYTVSLTVTGPGGSNTETKTSYISVSAPGPVASFTATPTSGQAPLAVSFTDTSTGNVTSWSWDFGDGATSTARNPSHTFDEGTFTVSLTVTGPGGSDTETRTDLIHAGASPGGQTLLAVADSRVSEGAQGSNFGTSTDLRVRGATNGSVHTYLRFDLTGTAQVTSARLRLFCTDQSSVGGLVFPTSSGWNESTINWLNKPAASGAQIASLGPVDQNAWIEVDVSAGVAGGGLVSFLLTGTVANSAVYSSRESVNPPQLVVTTAGPAGPTAAFSASPLAGTAPLGVTFTDQSTGAPTSWSWSFGDGGTSSAQNPVHVYTTAGLYTVTLEVSNASGTSQLTKTDLVDVDGPAGARTILPVADARVNESNPGSNYGTATELRVRSEVGGSYHTYLRFDLAGVSGITSARLRLFCTDGSPVGGLLFPTSSTWTETGITWTSKPAATGAQLASLGTVATGTWVEIDVTSAVSGPGLLSLLITSTSSNSALYSSREGTQPPELVVTTSGL